MTFINHIRSGRFFFIVMVYFLPAGNLYSQKIYWSDITEEDRRMAGDVISKFFDYIHSEMFDSLQQCLAGKTLAYGNIAVMDADEFITRMKTNLSGKDLSVERLNGYTFEDFLDNYKTNELLKRIYPYFDNHAILVHSNIRINAQPLDALFVLIEDMENHWKIHGIAGLGSPPLNRNTNINDSLSFRSERVPDTDITISLPDGFGEADTGGNQVNYSLQQETERDAVVQVMTDRLQAKIYFYTYKFVEFSNRQYDLKDLRVRYQPEGILFEYKVEDPYGITNIGKTLGIEHNGNAVIIQFYCLHDFYVKIRPAIEYLFGHVKFQ